MKIDLTDFLSSHESVLPLDISFSPADGADETGMIPDYIRIKEDGIRLEGELRGVGGYVTLTADVTVEYDTFCDRCLAPLSRSFTFGFERQIVLDPRRAPADDDGDTLAAEDGKIDLTEPLSEAIALEAPSLHLCREDCPGLCPTCGKLRSDPSCKCAEKKEIDPRLEILKKLLDNSEEV